MIDSYISIRKELFSEITQGSYEDILKKIHSLPDDWTVEQIGEGNDGHPMHKITRGDLKQKPIFFSVAGIHGGEWMAPHYQLEFANMISHPERYIPNPEVVVELREKYSFCFIPVGNPWGWVHHVYHNMNDVNLSHDYGIWGEKETRNIKKVWDELPQSPVFMLDCHEVQNVTPTNSIGANPDSPLSIRLAKETIDILNKQTETSYVSYPMVDYMNATRWSGSQTGSNDQPIISFFTESFYKEPTTTVERMHAGINNMYFLWIKMDTYLSGEN